MMNQLLCRDESCLGYFALKQPHKLGNRRYFHQNAD